MPKPQETNRKMVVEFKKPLGKSKSGGNFVIFKGLVVKSDKEHGVGKLITCLGNLNPVVIGAHYELTGTVKWSESYSEFQLHFDSYEFNQSATLTGLQNYLAKECEDIGTGRAEQIVKAYGEDAWKVLLTEPIRLTRDLVGVNIVVAKRIQAWAEQEEKFSTVKKLLYQAGAGPALIRKLLEAHGTGLMQVMRENAFDLTEVKGIGFLTADRLAHAFGMPPTHPQRIKEGIKYTLQKVTEERGHTCVQHHILVNEALKLLSLTKEPVIAAMKDMLDKQELVTQEADPKLFSRNPELFEE
jgi:exodeoxyribonuclease V alpha subunit